MVSFCLQGTLHAHMLTAETSSKRCLMKPTPTSLLQEAQEAFLHRLMWTVL